VDDVTVQRIASELIPVLEHYRKISQRENNRLKEKYGEEYSVERLTDKSTEYISAIQMVQAKINIISIMGGIPLMEDVYYTLNQKDTWLASSFSILADSIGGWAH
jgi:hypothetical protein